MDVYYSLFLYYTERSLALSTSPTLCDEYETKNCVVKLLCFIHFK